MSGKWQDVYAGLHNFITSNPGIIISNTGSSSVIAIPQEARNEFYRRFEAIRIAFLEENFPTLLREAEILGEHYTKAEQEVKALLKLDNIFLLGFLDGFLHNPKGELIKKLYNPLWEVLKGKMSFDAFEKRGIDDLAAIFEHCHRLGYAKWVALSLVKMLESDHIFSVTPPESKIDGHKQPRCLEIPAPPPKESMVLSFEHGPNDYPPFITPHFIVHSAKLDRYVSFRTELQKAEYIALNLSDNQEWYRLESIKQDYKLAMPNPSIIIYVADKLEELALIADKNVICRPDLIVECREPKDWDDKNTPVATKFYDILNPRLGRYIVSLEPVPEQVSQELTPEPAAQQLLDGQGTKMEEKLAIHSLTIGLEQSKLETIIEVLVSNYGSRAHEKIAD